MVAYTANPTQSHTYRVSLDHPVLPSGLVVVGDLPQVLVSVTGTAADLTHFDIRTLHASGDFSRVKPGNDRIPIHVVNPDPNVRIEAPPSLTIPIDEVASASLPVSIERVHTLPAGFHELTATTSVTPATVKVDGPKSQLIGVQAIVVVDMSGFTGPVDLIPTVVVRDAKKGTLLKSVTITPAQVSVKMTIQADAVTETKPVGWTLTGQPAAGYRVTNVTLSPLQVNATGLLNTLAGLNLVPTDPVDVSGATTDVIRTITIRPPTGVAVSQNTVQVHVFIAKSAQVQPTTSP